MISSIRDPGRLRLRTPRTRGACYPSRSKNLTAEAAVASARVSAMDLRPISIAATCAALNLGLGKIASLLMLPVYLDAIGTVLATALVPLPYALATGVASSLLGAVLINPATPFYTGTQVTIALVAFLGVRLGAMRRAYTAAIWGIVVGLAAALVSAPVTVVVFGGVTVSNATAINAVLMAAGHHIWQAVIAGSALIEAIDKPVACLLSWVILRRLPARLRPQG